MKYEQLVSINLSDGIQHIAVSCRGISEYVMPDLTTFKSMNELIEYYHAHSLSSDEGVFLRLEFMITLQCKVLYMYYREDASAIHTAV